MKSVLCCVVTQSHVFSRQSNTLSPSMNPSFMADDVSNTNNVQGMHHYTYIHVHVHVPVAVLFAELLNVYMYNVDVLCFSFYSY